MKKLKTVLILLLAALLSLGLFACKKKDDTPPDTPGPDESTESTVTKIKLSKTTITLTDSDEAAAYEAEKAKIVVTVTDNYGSDDEISVDDCNWEGNITYHEVGEYPITVSPKSDSKKKATLTVVIDHNWGAAANGIKTCQYSACGARQETRKEDVVMHYGTFHEGTDPKGYADAKAAAGWTETAAYTNKGTNSAISEFGPVGDHTVPTLTAGQLEPEMTITIRGKAKTTAAGTEAAPAGVWGHQQEQWNSPSLGIADRYATFAAHPDYKYGISVIVRQEGWVLYNGIGDTTANNSLAGIMGGTGTSVGDWRNYGSHPSETDTTSPKTGASSYVHGSNPATLDWSTVEDWWVYSTGTILQSGTYYQNEGGDDFEYSWTYRKDGVIEISYSIINGVARTTLKAYIKVPDSEVGYYDTIIHGDYNDMTITESVITTKRTPKDNGFTYKGLKSGANKVYAENTAFDASTLNVTVKYEQTGDTENPLRVANSQVYYYKGNLSRADLVKPENKEELESLDASKWVSLGTSNLKADAIYKLHIAKGGKTFVTLIGEDDFEVFPNKVGSALGADVNVIEGVSFANNGKVGVFNFSVDTTAKNVVLTLAGEGYVQALTAEQTAKFSGGVNGATKYVAIRLNGAELGEKFTDTAVTVKKGSDTVPSIAKVEGDDLYLVIALKEAGKYTIEGAQDSKIVLDLTALKGFEFSSTISGDLDLFNGGTVTLTYTVPANTHDTDLKFSGGGSSDVAVNSLTALAADKDWDLYNGYVIDSATLTGTTLTVVVKVGGASLVNYAPATFKLSNATDSIVDTVDYKLALDAASYEGKVKGTENHFAFIQNSGTLSVIRAFPVSDGKLEDGKIVGKFTLNLNNGDFETFKKNGLIEVSYRVVGGELVFLNAPAGVTGSVTFLGTYGDNRDTDKGAFVIVSIRTSSLGISGDYYFNFNDGEPFNSEEKPTEIIKVNNLTITPVTVEADDCELAIVTEGSCQQEGLYAWAVTVDGKIVFYANAASAGGAHVDEDGDNKCDLCDSAISEVSLTHNEDDQQNELHDGEFVEISGQYNSSDHKQAYNGIETNIRQKSGDAFYVRVRNDGFYARETGDDAQITLDSNSTPANTCNGVPNGIDGTAIDAASDYLEAKKEGYFKVYASYVDRVVTVVTKLWTKNQAMTDTPYFQYTVQMTVTSPDADSILVKFRLDNWSGSADISPEVQTNGKCNLVKGNVSNSTISSIEFAQVGTHTAPTGMAVTNNGNKVVLDGNAATEGDAYYTAFKITFSKAVVAGTTTVRMADGSVYEGATAEFDATRTALSVYLPLSSDVTSAVIDFVNFAGSTVQNDITLDLSKVLYSDVKVTADKTDLKLVGDTFTLTFTGSIPATAKLAIGEDSVALSALASASGTAPVAIGSSLFSVTGYDASAKKITIKYAGVKDYTVDIAETVITLTTENGAALTRISVYPNTLEGLARQVESSGWYLVAVGGKLVLISDKAEEETLPVIVNAGKAASDLNAVGVYNLGYKNNKFVDSNTATGAAVVKTVTLNGKTVTAIVVTVKDLAGLGITESGAYGVMLATEGATKYYAVAADRTIAEKDATQGTEKELGAHSCDAVGKQAKTDSGESFYWDLTVVPSHTYPASPDENGNYVCTVCGAILKAGSVKNSVIPAQAFEEKSLVETGLSISMQVSENAGGDFTSILVRTGSNAIITMPNLDPWNVNAAAGLSDEIKALADKIKGGNAVPSVNNGIGILAGNHTWDEPQGKSFYVTVVISKTAGIKIYMNGDLFITYNADGVVSKGTVADVAEFMLADIANGGFTLADGALITAASNAIVEAKVYTDEDASTRYNNYVAEKDYYPEGAPAPTHPEYTEDPSSDHAVSITATGYSPNMYYFPIAKGEKVVMTGTLTGASGADHAPAWQALVVSLFSGPSFSKGIMRSDRCFLNGDALKTEEGLNWEWSAVDDGQVVDVTSHEPYETNLADFMRGKTHDMQLTVDYSDPSKLVITIRYDSQSDETYMAMTYTFTSGTTQLKDAYSFGIGGDTCTGSFTSCTRTPAAD